MKKKIFTLLLSVIMIFSMAVPTFAGSAYCNKVNKQPVYVALGDSIGTGFNVMEGATNNHVKFIGFGEDGEKDRTFTTVPESYPALVAKNINADPEKSYNDVYCGLRPKDMCFIFDLIEGDMQECSGDYYKTIATTYTNSEGKKVITETDWFSQLLTCGAGEEMSWLIGDQPIRNMKSDVNRESFLTVLKDADVITVELGCNDLTALMVNKSGEMGAGIAGAFGKLGVIPTHIQKLTDILSNNESTYEEKLCALFKLMDEATKNGIDVLSNIKLLDDTTNVAVTEFKTYFDKMMKHIRSINPRAKIAVVTLYNPMTNLSWDLFGASADTINTVIEPIMQLYVNKMNNHIKTRAIKYNYAVADISGKVEPHKDNMFHPDMDGQKKMADIITMALSKYKVKTAIQLSCEHSKTITCGAKEATYLKKGYTGDTVCVKCGKTITVGDIIPKLVPTATAITKTSGRSRSIVVKWKKQEAVSGYQIQYSTSSDFNTNRKNICVGKANVTSTKIKNLKTNKKYYVRVRTYKLEKGIKCYSIWSNPAEVTTRTLPRLMIESFLRGFFR